MPKDKGYGAQTPVDKSLSANTPKSYKMKGSKGYKDAGVNMGKGWHGGGGKDQMAVESVTGDAQDLNADF